LFGLHNKGRHSYYRNEQM